MNKTTLTIIAILLHLNIYCQVYKVNDKKFTTLIFESNIVSAIVGNDDYSFEYNEEEEGDNVALIKALNKNAQETSLVIKTKNGTIFNLDIAYGTEIKSIIEISDSIGVSLKNKKVQSKTTEKNKDNIKGSIRENDYTIGNSVINDNENKNVDCEECTKLIKKGKKIRNIFDATYNIKAELFDVYYINKSLYFVININNNSDLDFSINYIKSYVDTNNENASSTSQYLEKDPKLIYSSLRTIKGKSERVMIFVYEQFSIDKNKKIVFEINEKDGERNLFLKIPHFLVNNPKKFTK